ncbi:MAG: hypothetical protein ABIF10_08465 [Candidatus Woesearchaeota archaeon]
MRFRDKPRPRIEMGQILNMNIQTLLIILALAALVIGGIIAIKLSGLMNGFK